MPASGRSSTPSARCCPWLAPRLRAALTSVNDLTLLPVRITTVDSWTRPGLVLIGDAAHVVSPVGGNGINLALADAAELANQLVGPLRLRMPGRDALDAAAARLETVRRPGVEAEQRRQVRTEAAAAKRNASGVVAPPTALRVLSAIPGFPRLAARRAGVRVPAPVPVIASGRGAIADRMLSVAPPTSDAAVRHGCIPRASRPHHAASPPPRWSPMRSGSTRVTSSPSTTRSASIPGARVPRRYSSPAIQAVSTVSERSAVTASTRSSGPIARPDDVRRCTIPCIVRSGWPSATHGRSDDAGTRTPARRNDACR